MVNLILHAIEARSLFDESRCESALFSWKLKFIDVVVLADVHEKGVKELHDAGVIFDQVGPEVSELFVIDCAQLQVKLL